MKNFRKVWIFPLLVSLSWMAFAQAPNKRLILKDGSYQIVKKYEVVGDRVRYISAERGGDWEELPANLVDWAATEAWAKAHAPGAGPPVMTDQTSAPPGSPEAAEIDREAKAEREEATPTVEPGLRLPDLDGVFILDTFQGQPELIDVPQNSGGLNTGTPHNVLKAMIPAGGSKQLITLEGYKAKVQLHVNQPVIYVSLDDGKESKESEEASNGAITVDTHGASSVKEKHGQSSPTSRYAIVRMQVKRETRVLGAMKLSSLGKPEQSVDIVETNSEILPGRHWMKLTPKQPLDIQEYALVEMLSPKEINLAVWDFGVNPRAPEAKNATSPVELAK
jgi:hypothetical protein